MKLLVLSLTVLGRAFDHWPPIQTIRVHGTSLHVRLSHVPSTSQGQRAIDHLGYSSGRAPYSTVCIGSFRVFREAPRAVQYVVQC